jgi:hypothetical protein
MIYTVMQGLDFVSVSHVLPVEESFEWMWHFRCAMGPMEAMHGNPVLFSPLASSLEQG